MRRKRAWRGQSTVNEALAMQRSRGAIEIAPLINSCSSAPELPGFVWDAEKERYFPANAMPRKAEAKRHAIQMTLPNADFDSMAEESAKPALQCSSVLSMLLARELGGSPSRTAAMTEVVVSSRVLHSISTPDTAFEDSLRDCDTSTSGFTRGCAEGFLKRLKAKKPRHVMM